MKLLKTSCRIINYKYHQGSGEKIVLILPPDMNNNGFDNVVVKVMCSAFKSLGFSIMCFNYDEKFTTDKLVSMEVKILKELNICLDWLKSKNQKYNELWLCGYQLGATIVMNDVLRIPDVNGFIVISPDVILKGFSILTPCPSGSLIYFNDNTDTIKDNVVYLHKNLLRGRNSVVNFLTVDRTKPNYKQNLCNLVKSEVVNHNPVQLKVDRLLVKREIRIANSM